MKIKILIVFSIFFLAFSILVLAANPAERIKPVTPDNVSQWDGVGGACTAGTHYDCVDEDVSDDESSYVECIANSLMYEFYNTNASFTTEEIKNVTVYTTSCAESNKGTDFAICVNISGTSYCNTGVSITSVCPTYDQISWFMDDNPATSSEWTVTAVNEMLIGASAGVDCNPDVHMTQVYATVGWEDAAGVTYCTGSDPYTEDSGDWSITGATTCENEVFDVTGNVSISSTGTLNLINTTMSMANTKNLSNIWVDGGKFYANESSNITTNKSNINFRIYTNAGTGFHINDSFIEKVGYFVTNAISIDHSDAIIRNTSITAGGLAETLNLSENNLLIYNNTIISTGMGIRFWYVTGSNISNNIVSTDDASMYVAGLNGSVIDNNELTSSVADAITFASYDVNFTNFTYNTLVSGTGSADWGIQASKNDIYNRYENNKIYGGEGGIYLTNTNPSNSYAEINNNEFWSISSSARGLVITDQNYTMTINNTFYNMTDFTNITGYYSNITNNTFIQDTASVYAVVLYGWYNNFSDNNITSDGYGLYTTDREGFILNNYINADDRAFWLPKGAVYNNISWNTIHSDTAFVNASYIWSDHNVFYNNTHWAGGGSALKVYGGDNNSFYEDDITISLYVEYLSNGTGTNYFYDVDFTKDQVTIQDTSELEVYWSTIGNVTDTENTPLEDANVTAYNSTHLVWWNMTDATGYTDWEFLEEYTQDSGGQTFQTNYTFNATLATYTTPHEEINLTYAQTQVNITMTAGVQTLDRAIYDSSNTNDYIYIRANTKADIYDSSDTNDYVFVYGRVTREIYDTSTAVDYVDVVITASVDRSIYDTSDTNDYISINGEAVSSIYDTSKANDYISTIVGIDRSIYDTSGTKDYITAVISATIERSVYDSSDTNDYIERVIEAAVDRSVYDSADSEDYVTSMVNALIDVYDSSSTNDYIIRSITAATTNREVYDSSGTNDYTTRSITATINRYIYDTSDTNDYVTRNINATLDVSIYDSSGANDYVTRFITEAGGALTITINTPPELTVTDVNQNDTFWVNTTIQCINDDCGVVTSNVRRNTTGASPGDMISTTPATPFYLTYGSQPESCGTMNQNDYCYANWTVNATNFVNSVWAIDVNASGVTASESNSADAWIYINATGIPSVYVPDVVVCMDTKHRKVCINIRSNTIFIYPKE